MEKLLMKKFKNEVFEVEPCLCFRFYVEFDEKMEISPQSVESIDMPKVSIKEDGETEWSPMKMRLMELSDDQSVTSRIMWWLLSKKLQKIIVTQIDANNTDMYSWDLNECKILNIDFGQCNYKGEGIQTIEVTFQPQTCKFNKK